MNDDENLPKFMRPKKLEECKDRAMWSKQFRTAFYLFWAASFIAWLGFDRIGLALAFLGVAFLILVTDAFLDVRHVMWHVRNNEKGEKHE